MWLGGSNSSDEQLIVPSLYRSGVRPNSGADHPSTLPIPTLVRPTAITYSSAFEDTDYRAANGSAGTGVGSHPGSHIMCSVTSLMSPKVRRQHQVS